MAPNMAPSTSLFDCLFLSFFPPLLFFFLTLAPRDKEQTMLNLKEEYILYAWQRVLHLLTDLNKIPTPSNFLAAFTGVDNLVNVFLEVKENLVVIFSFFSLSSPPPLFFFSPPPPQPPSVLPPNGNTILHIFGKWLFEAIQLNRRGFEEGTSLAIKTLSGIFSERTKAVFLNTYLASYYRSLQEVCVYFCVFGVNLKERENFEKKSFLLGLTLRWETIGCRYFEYSNPSRPRDEWFSFSPFLFHFLSSFFVFIPSPLF